jgi:hypothetical protein
MLDWGSTTGKTAAPGKYYLARYEQHLAKVWMQKLQEMKVADVKEAKKKIKDVTGFEIEEKIIRIAAHPITYDKNDGTSGIALGLEVSSPDLIMHIVEKDDTDAFATALRTAAAASKIVEAQDLDDKSEAAMMALDAMVKLVGNDIITREYTVLKDKIGSN